MLVHPVVTALNLVTSVSKTMRYRYEEINVRIPFSLAHPRHARFTRKNAFVRLITSKNPGFLWHLWLKESEELVITSRRTEGTIQTHPTVTKINDSNPLASFLSAEPPWGWKGRYVMGLFAPASISYDPRLAPVTDGERRTKGTGRRWEEGNSSFIQVLYFLPVYIVDSLTVKMASGN